jgi:hypothetical protein
LTDEEVAVLLAVYSLGSTYTSTSREEELKVGELNIVKTSNFEKLPQVHNPRVDPVDMVAQMARQVIAAERQLKVAQALLETWAIFMAADVEKDLKKKKATKVETI